jgi:hypothetical protein
MKKPIVVLGIGELGSVFARAFLKNNHAVYPITRSTDINELKASIDPELILVCTAESDLQSALSSIPSEWKDRVAMMQNELLPRDWETHNFTNPTVISVWFEKKKGMDSKVLISSPAFGPKARTLTDSLALIDIPAHVVANKDELLFELVLKNLYILTTNIAGLAIHSSPLGGVAIESGANVNDLRNNHLQLMREVSIDILKLQTALTGKTFDDEALEQGMIEAFEGDLEHGCMGRSAPARLNRALQLAQEFNLEVSTLQKIKDNS